MKKTIYLLIICLLFTGINIFASAEVPENAIGVIEVPCLEITLPLYASEVNDHDHRQEIIDNENSALYTNWGTAYCILDHLFSQDNNNGEWNIQKVFSGAYATIIFKDHKYLYECYMTAKTDYINGEEFYNGRLITPCSSHDILIGCCAEDVNHHYVAVFRRLREF